MSWAYTHRTFPVAVCVAIIVGSVFPLIFTSFQNTATFVFALSRHCARSFPEKRPDMYDKNIIAHPGIYFHSNRIFALQINFKG